MPMVGTKHYKRGDRVERQFPGQPATQGRIIRVDGREITVEWDWGGFPQVLPPDQQRYVRGI